MAMIAALEHMHNDDHGNEAGAMSPSKTRALLISALQAPDADAGDYGGKMGRRASALTQAMAVQSLDPVIKKRMPPTLIVAQMFFKKPVDLASLRDVLKSRLMAIPRFRCVITEDTREHLFMLKALPLSECNMDYHLKVMANAEEPWSRTRVDAFLSEVYKGQHDALDYSEPPWRCYVFAMTDGRTLVSPIIDHALADGISAVAVLMAILDDGEEDAPDGVKPITKRTGGPPMSLTGRIHALLWGVKEAFLGPMLPGDPMNLLKEKDHRNPCLDKSCASSERISLQEMKRVKARFPGATVNDIMLATLTLTIQRYYREKGEDLTTIRGNFPINMRPPNEKVLQKSMGNKFAAANFSFPLSETDPVKIVWNVKNQVDTIKNSPAPLLQSKLFGILIPKLVSGGSSWRQAMFNMTLDIYGKVTVMLSNVPGPSAEVRLCGQPLDDMNFYALSGLGVYFGLLSYNGGVNLGVTTGKGVEPDAAEVAKHWGPAFRHLVGAVDAASDAQLAKPRTYGDAKLLLVLVGLAAFFLRLAMRSKGSAQSSG